MLFLSCSGKSEHVVSCAMCLDGMLPTRSVTHTSCFWRVWLNTMSVKVILRKYCGNHKQSAWQKKTSCWNLSVILHPPCCKHRMHVTSFTAQYACLPCIVTSIQPQSANKPSQVWSHLLNNWHLKICWKNLRLLALTPTPYRNNTNISMWTTKQGKQQTESLFTRHAYLQYGNNARPNMDNDSSCHSSID